MPIEYTYLSYLGPIGVSYYNVHDTKKYFYKMSVLVKVTDSTVSLSVFLFSTPS